METDLNAGNLREPTAIMLSEFITEHLDIAATQVRPSTVRDHKITLHQFLNHVKDRRMDTLTMAKVEAFLGRRRSEGVSEATANKLLRTLKSIFARAMARGYLASNPCAGVRKLREPERTYRILTADEVKSLVDACRVLRWRVLIYLAVTTGMRIGELVNLRWEDVDLHGGAITIRCRDDFRPKSGHNRTAPLSNEAVAGLAELRDAGEHDEWVFSTNGQRMGIDVHRTLAAIQRDAGLADNPFTFHDLRRTFLSHLQMAGVSSAVAQKLAGHSSISTTEKFYTRILPDALRAAPARLPYVEIGITSFSRLAAGTAGKAKTA
jgi:integrase